ncbi:hypothetical protein [Dickeya sp. NCPPB 3274]|uniref:hypothetical protein n=1 Tax=Dickeya sp. NCPPB 3274 TaxID=568766 RepID=UPI00187C3C0D|nr:hypothetical protein [Dickeya sp. NCPPB 3274]
MKELARMYAAQASKEAKDYRQKALTTDLELAARHYTEMAELKEASAFMWELLGQ